MEGWKDVAMQLLDKVRNGSSLSETELSILAQMYQKTKQGGYPAELEHAAAELLTLIEMIFYIHDQLIKDEGEHRGDRSNPDGH